MVFDGYDFIIVGVILGAGSTLLFAKAYMMPSFPEETTATYLGHNPFQLRNIITTRHEAIGGCVWLVLGLAVTLIGTVRSVRARHSGYLISAWYDILVLLAFALVLWRLTVVVTDRTSRAEYVPIFIDMMREVFELSAHSLFHEGRSSAEVTLGTKLDDGMIAKRLSEAHDRLERVGKLLDEPRAPGDDDKQLAKRLGKYFPGAKVE